MGSFFKWEGGGQRYRNTLYRLVYKLAFGPFDTIIFVLLRLLPGFYVLTGYSFLSFTLLNLFENYSMLTLNLMFSQCLSNVFLNTFSDSAQTIFVGRLFQLFIILLEKKCWNFLVLQRGLYSLLVLDLVILLMFLVINDLVVTLSYILWIIL